MTHTVKRPLLPLLCLAAISVAASSEAQFLKPQLVLHGNKSSVEVDVELARTPGEQQRGLMFRQELAATSGMLFIYTYDDDHSFWMKNTYIPLDMVFIDKNGVVVGIIENATPMTLTPRHVGGPSRFVLELNAWFCRSHGITVGSKVEMRGIPIDD